MGDLIKMFSYPFLLNALLVGSLVSLSAALLGSSLVLRRYSMIGDGLSHVGFGALAIATVLNITPLVFATPVVMVAAIMLLRVSENNILRGEQLIAVISTGALALGVFIISLVKGVNTDINSFLFGSILALSDTDVWVSAIASIILIALFILCYNKIFAITFDEEFARATGVRVKLYNTLLAALTAIIIVLGMRMMGALLISSLVIFPSLSAMRFRITYKGAAILAAILSLLCFIAGLVLSFILSTPTGATVVLINLVCFVICFVNGKVNE